jgi:para-aminobenzoate synthetase/4-amino-4-deoxychorismate lyase
MTPADRTRRAERRPQGPAALSETFVLLDNNSGGGPPSLLFTDPVEIIAAETPEEVASALQRLDAAVKSGLHAAGFFSYELGYVLEPRLSALMPQRRNVPLIWLGLYEAPAEMTPAQVEHWLATHTRSGTYHFTDVSLAWDDAFYQERFAEVQEKIRSGDIYQLNLTFKARFLLSGSPLTFFLDLRRKQRVAYGGIVDTGKVTVLSASPELFIELQGRRIATRPMKGTAPRAGTLEADALARRQLSEDTKQRAENLMIVDLMRNDIGRISEIGSVCVTDLYTVETFQTLHQMTSGVEATLKEGIGMAELLRAIFPPGSVTGAPKIRAMELIAGLEIEPRGVYCGAIGYVSPKGRALFNVAIRTAVIFRDANGEMGIGSGIVFDSQGAKEYAECLLKMKFLTDPVKPFDLIETMLFDPERGGYALLDRHIDRLKTSARYFAFACDEAAVRRALQEAVAGARERLRVRLLLSAEGNVSVTTTPLPPPHPNPVMRFVVSETRLNSADIFLYHKTTRRELFDREWQHYSDSVGADEVIYLNERGELCEGSRTTIFLERGGRLLTPALSSGLLPGTLRAELLCQGRASEAVLTLEDLGAADAVYLGNSVRGLLPALPLHASSLKLKEGK